MFYQSLLNLFLETASFIEGKWSFLENLKTKCFPDTLNEWPWDSEHRNIALFVEADIRQNKRTQNSHYIYNFYFSIGMRACEHTTDVYKSI